MKKLIAVAAAALALVATPALAQSYQEPAIIGAPAGAPQIAYGANPYGRTYATPAHAQPRAVYAPPGQVPNFGGGFIEGMVVGREPAYRPERRTYAVPNTNGTIYAVPGRALVLPPEERRVYRDRRSQSASLNAAPAARRTLNPAFKRTEIDYSGPYEPGTIIVDTSTRFLTLVEKGGRAVRYGVGVGKEGFGWKGTEKITRKAEWPDWRPPAEMLKRRPDLPTFMAGGPSNPLGARALYLGNTLYRIHGSNEPWTIGQAVSSGCIRMTNEDVTDLYGRVGVGTKVVVL
jgi:lipoprotein-anchoring transpeptidase ErfK/SrfK